VSIHRANVETVIATARRVAQRPAPDPSIMEISGGLRIEISQRDLVFFFDLWVLLGILWVSRVGTENVDLGVGVFGLATFALVVFPKTSRERLGANALDDVGSIFKRVCIAYAAGSALIVLVDSGSTRALLGVAASTVPLLIIGRAIAYHIERSLRRRGSRSRVLVVGGGTIARRVVTTLAQHPEYGLQVVGAADDNPRLSPSELGAPVLGNLIEVPMLVRAHRVDIVIVAFSSSEHGSMVDVIRAAMANGAQGWVIPRFFELGCRQAVGDHLWGLPVVRLQKPARSRPEWILKRLLDFLLAGIGVVALSPLMLIIAGVIYLESGRPLLFKQTRLGLNGREFDILKFRTMKVVDEGVASAEWAADRRRVTRVGRLLRDSNLDELPQLFNILRGEMSLVGPRPERPYFVQMFSERFPNYGSRHRFPAGLTGWAQIHGLRGDTSIEERVAFDNYYIENWSLAQDTKILAKSVTLLMGKWKNRSVNRSAPG
jgi:exopolysaccharide biosynthesis polyprenyl glycosylphosphotransferase